MGRKIVLPIIICYILIMFVNFPIAMSEKIRLTPISVNANISTDNKHIC